MEISEKTVTNKIQQTEYKLMYSLLARYLTEGNSISLWRLPNATKKNLIICTEGIRQIQDVVLEEIGTGFIFSPFNSEKKKAFLKANITFSFERGEVIADTEMEELDDPSKTSDSGGISKSDQLPFYSSAITEKENATRDQFIHLIEKSISLIQTTQVEKLVPSRCKQVTLPDNFDLLSVFNSLCSLYPNAFISLVSTPEYGTWIGASPELLVSVDANMRFKTVAVAGTQTISSDDDLKMVAWTQKEIEEQALVSRYIINCFKKIRLREFDEHGPKSWRAGNLVHLKTEYEVDTVATNFPQLGTVMLKLLHPTSAVCGMPREESIYFLKANEDFDRSFYSGFLGPVNFQNETSLFVNLRCMEWNLRTATLYAGAGVTQDSDPAKEWEETEQKMETLLKVIAP